MPQNESPANLPNIFANFVQSKIAKIQNSIDTICCSNKFETNLKNFTGTSFENFTLTTQAQANNIIRSLYTTTCNLDPIPTTVLKKCSGIIAAITAIINFSLQNAVVPLELKKAIVSPLLKNQNPVTNSLSNYRPISHLSFSSKIFEKIVAGQLLEHLTLHSLLDKFQSAYRPGFSTETALIKITNDILTAIDKNSFTALIMINMSAAFDTINHQTLLSRLSKLYGIKGSVLTWFDSFLKDKHQTVHINNFVSDSFMLTSGSLKDQYLHHFYSVFT